MPCKQHTRYKGKGKPTSSCETCWRLYIRWKDWTSFEKDAKKKLKRVM